MPKTKNTPKILKTKKWGKFTKLLGNREINTANLKTVTASIERNNLLEVNPIIVNENLEVIDGQHRLEAAIQLGLDIYYVISKGATIDDVTWLNTAKKNWQILNRLDSYVDRGYKDYIYLRDFKDKHNFTINMSLALLTGYDSKKVQVDKFCKGKLRITRKKTANEIADFINSVADGFPHYKSKNFVMSIVGIWKQNNADLERLAKCVVNGMDGTGIPRCTTITKTTQEIQNAYNKNMRQVNRRMFVKL